ncbi:hypothetical protein [Streptomyces mayteni]
MPRAHHAQPATVATLFTLALLTAGCAPVGTTPHPPEPATTSEPAEPSLEVSPPSEGGVADFGWAERGWDQREWNEWMAEECGGPSAPEDVIHACVVVDVDDIP